MITAGLLSCIVPVKTMYIKRKLVVMNPVQLFKGQLQPIYTSEEYKTYLLPERKILVPPRMYKIKSRTTI